VFTIAGVSLIGLPPIAGFIAKWLLLTTSIENGQWWWAIIVLAGGLMASMYLFKILNLAFDREPVDLGAAQPVPPTLTTVALVLALITLALGFNAEFILSIINPPVGVGA
jgi:NADH:ubiquinone oxidoreductase subunit 2 (subunit N)